MSKSVPAKGVRWNLSEIYTSLKDPQIAKDKKQIEKLTSEFIKKYKGKINNKGLTSKKLLEAIKDSESLDSKIYFLENFAGYHYSLNSKSESVKKFYAEIDEFSNDNGSKLKWFLLEIQALPEDLFKRLLNAKELASYRHYLKHIRVFSKYKLSEPEEIIITKKNLTGSSAFVNFYDEALSAEMFDLNYKGKSKKLTYSEIADLMKSNQDRKLREVASNIYTKNFKEKEHFYTFILNNLLLDKKISDEIRGYKYPQQATFLSYEVEPEMVEALKKSVQKRYPLVERYYKSKAKLLKLDKLFEWDRYSAPFPEESFKYSWEDARQIILTSFKRFNPEFAKIANLFFKNGWIDAEVRSNKKTGAYCSYNIPSHHPYVLVNFMGGTDDVTTLAHELGHAIHAYLARQNSVANFWPSTATAEIASVFCESIVDDLLIKQNTNKKIKINMLASKIQGSFATIFRQIAFYDFEMKLHDHRKTKGNLSTEQISNYFQQSLQPMFGKGLTLTDQHQFWWMPVLHFYHYNFYVFTYAFGEALTYALFEKYKQSGDAFIEKYKKALSSGGSKTPKEIVKVMDIDITDPSFWNRGIDLIEDQVNEFEQLISVV